MKNQTLQVPYIIILDKVKRDCDTEGIIPVKKFRYIVNVKFHIGKENLYKMLNELESLGVIEYLDHKTIRIKWQPNF